MLLLQRCSSTCKRGVQQEPSQHQPVARGPASASSAALYDEFFNVHFEDLGQSRRKARAAPHATASGEGREQAGQAPEGAATDSQASARRRRSGSSGSACSSSAGNSSTSFKPPKEARRGLSWFAEHYGLDLEGLEELAAAQQQQRQQRMAVARSRSGHGERRGRRGGSTPQDGGATWEDEVGCRWTEPASSSYNRAFAEHERSWFEAWQAASAASSSARRFSDGPTAAEEGFRERHSNGGTGGGGGSGETWQQWSSSAGHQQRSAGSSGSSSDSHTSSHVIASALHALGLNASGLASLSRSGLKAAYHRAAKQWHPDRHTDAAAKQAAQEHFRRAAEAYAALQAHVIG